MTFEQEIVACMPVMKRQAAKLSKSSSDVEDIVQDALLRALAHKHTFKPGTNLPGWLITITRNAYYERYRRRKREVEDPDGIMASFLVDDAAANHDSAIDLRRVMAEIDVLPPALRSLILDDVDGYSYEEMASRHRLPLGTVKSRLSRLRVKLKAQVGE